MLSIDSFTRYWQGLNYELLKHILIPKSCKMRFDAEKAQKIFKENMDKKTSPIYAE